MAEKARRLIERADAGQLTLVVVPVILAETFFTLESYYDINQGCCRKARTLFELPGNPSAGEGSVA